MVWLCVPELADTAGGATLKRLFALDVEDLVHDAPFAIEAHEEEVVGEDGGGVIEGGASDGSVAADFEEVDRALALGLVGGRGAGEAALVIGQGPIGESAVETDALDAGGGVEGAVHFRRVGGGVAAEVGLEGEAGGRVGRGLGQRECSEGERAKSKAHARIDAASADWVDARASATWGAGWA